MILYALIIGWLLPFLGFWVLVFFGRRIGEPKAGIFSSGLMITSALIALVSAVQWIAMDHAGAAGLFVPIPWVYIGGQLINVGIRVDSLTIVMNVMVTVVASVIFVYSIGYMRGDKRFSRFFTYLNLFGFSMLGLVLAASLVGLYIFWELVGICSYFLIGFWFEKQSASDAAKKAFVVNRVGDFLFVVGIAVVLAVTGSVTLESIFHHIRQGAFADHTTLLTFAGICLFCGAVGKSAQFPLHVWLPDAMEGPTPVSALIHAATMVAAGVYLVARIFPMLTPDALLVVAYIGAVTLFGSALIAIVMTDIKRVLAYSTISQLGYMILSLGVGGWVAGLFHLITHACFKALLFMGSGSVIHGCGGEQDIRKMGNLHRKMPITSITFLIATMAISGVPLLSGAYSKDAMLASMLSFAWEHETHWLLYVLPAVAAAITAFYMMRLYLLTFHTSARDENIYRHAHESPKVMWIPMAVLAALTIGIGWFGQMPQRTSMGEGQYAYSRGRGLEGIIADAQPRWAISWQMNETAAPFHGAGADAARAEPQQIREHNSFHIAAIIIATTATALGFLLAYLMYSLGLVSAEKAAARFQTMYRLFNNKFYVDEIYRAVFVAGGMKFAAFGRWCDRTVLDGMVNGTAGMTVAIGNIARKGQTGRIRDYLLAMATIVAGVIFYIGLYHWF